MSINELMSLKDGIIEASLWDFYSKGEIIVTVMFGILIALSVLIGILDRDWGALKPIAVFAIVGGVFVYIGLSIGRDDLYDKEINKWEKESVIPFIEELPKEKREIIYIKIDPELETIVSGSSFIGTGFVTSKTKRLTSLTISYKNSHGINTITDWFSTEMVLTNNATPYIEYQYLDRDVSDNFQKGMYNRTIYLPKNYQFTDIK